MTGWSFGKTGQQNENGNRIELPFEGSDSAFLLMPDRI